MLCNMYNMYFVLYYMYYTLTRVSRVAQLVAQRIDYHLRPNAVCTIPVQSSNFVMRFTCTEKTLAYYLCSLIGHEYAAQLANCVTKEPALWQITCGTIIQLCRKEHAIGKIT